MKQSSPYNYHINFTHINECIYCKREVGFSELSREHIIPKSLNGWWVLPLASCMMCRELTSSFETDAIKSMFSTIRKADKFSSYHKKDKDEDKTVNAEIIFIGEKQAVKAEVSSEYAFKTKSTVLFKIPLILKKTQPKVRSKWNWEGHKIEMVHNPAISNIFHDNNHIESISFSTGSDISSYSLMLAKIAHAFAIGIIGKNSFTPYLTKYILNSDSSELDYYLGCVQQTEWNPPIDVMHEASLVFIPHPTIRNRLLVMVNLRLISYLGGPYTQVIVGHLIDESFISQINKKLKYKIPLSIIDKPKIHNLFPIRVDYNSLRKFVKYYHHKI